VRRQTKQNPTDAGPREAGNIIDGMRFMAQVVVRRDCSIAEHAWFFCFAALT